MTIISDTFFKRIVGAVLFGLATYVFFRYVLGLVSPFLFAYLVSVVVEPFVGFMERRGLSRGLSSVISISCFLLATITLGAYFAGNVWSEAIQFTAQIPAFISELQKLFDGIVQSSGLYDISTPPWISDWGDIIITNISHLAQASIGDGVTTTSLSFFRSLPAFIMWLILFVLSSFFFIKDRHLIHSTIYAILPSFVSSKLLHIRTGLVSAFWGYIRAQGIIMSVIATISIVALLFRSSPYALFIGILIAFLDAMPIIGSSLILFPWSILSFIEGDTSSAIYFIALWGINFLTRQLLEPKLISSQIGLHPLLTLLSIYVGLRTIGPLGMIVGPLWTMTLKIGLGKLDD